MTATQHETRPGSRITVAIPGEYLSLTTYKRAGSPVSTPVWFVEEDGRLFVITGAGSHKVRRLLRNSACMVALCSARGVPKADASPARAEFLPQPEHGRIDRLMAEKYRFDRLLILPIYLLVMRLRGKPAGGAGTGAYLAITPG